MGFFLGARWPFGSHRPDQLPLPQHLPQDLSTVSGNWPPSPQVFLLWPKHPILSHLTCPVPRPGLPSISVTW